MCGITGFLSGESTSQDVATRLIECMTDTLVHRGPDDEGTWVDTNHGVALGHRRLSIIDLSAAGQQPMTSPDGRFVVTLNGEIYNYQDLRTELSEHHYRFRGNSDTEVAAVAFQHFGIAEALERFTGMFAFAVWDREKKVLSLARDRMGEKPLYYALLENDFLYGSELKALRQFPGWNRSIDTDALGLLLRHCYIPGHRTIYQDVYKLEPGCLLQIGSRAGIEKPKITPYWSVDSLAHRESRISETTEVIRGLEETLLNTIEKQMISDVPLGAFLSGGVDSSLIVAMMQKLSSRKIRTFSIGFDEAEYNEAHFAAAVAEHIQTDHTELYVSPQQALDVIPKLPLIYDEPFADSSQIPTYLVSALTREHVTVALSGDGGDELFGGYGRYQVGRDRWSEVERYPSWLRNYVAPALSSLPYEHLDKLLAILNKFSGNKIRFPMTNNRIQQKLKRVSGESMHDIYNQLLTLWPEPGAIVKGFGGVDVIQDLQPSLEPLSDFTERMMLTDIHTYLPDDIMVKVDRASMACSLEVRAPFLDPAVVDFAWSISPEIRLMDGQGKWPLREILHNYVPRHLVDRPKMGFGVPIDHWLRNELREWGENLLSVASLSDHGLFHVGPIREKWLAHQKGDANWHYWLWPVLMFQAWYRHYER